MTYSKKDLILLKKKYNRTLIRSKNAEEFFRTKSIAECLRYLNLFNEITQELGKLIFLIEYIIGQELDYETKINGFKEVRNERNK
ncbi:hypothetical protein B0H39_004641 [Clostridium beijerinckii]|uniref:hypothetical protein n=1 Tax=Clostridium beijerinckii TaxID=1520 RepID=UPI001493F38D|nr:hypothetical protein [Clostridium beijerinckii]NOW86760.1 hypothetical protein [Clostridium beijerinckii]